MEEIKKIKCKSCGYVNILGTKKCVRCKKRLEQVTKSCPKCAKKNILEVTRCVKCGYRFDKKKKSVLFNFLLSISLVIILFLLLFLDKKGLVGNLNKGFKVLACFLVLGIICSIFLYGRKDIVSYHKENEFVKEDKRINKLKIASNLAIILGGILVFVLLLYFLF